MSLSKIIIKAVVFPNHVTYWSLWGWAFEADASLTGIWWLKFECFYQFSISNCLFQISYRRNRILKLKFSDVRLIWETKINITLCVVLWMHKGPIEFWGTIVDDFHTQRATNMYIAMLAKRQSPFNLNTIDRHPHI